MSECNPEADSELGSKMSANSVHSHMQAVQGRMDALVVKHTQQCSESNTRLKLLQELHVWLKSMRNSVTELEQSSSVCTHSDVLLEFTLAAAQLTQAIADNSSPT
jgi:hypothetical protein